MVWPFTKKKIEKLPHTPDLAILENRPKHLLFHYGDALSHVPKVCGAFTDEKMILWSSRTGVIVSPVALQLHVKFNPDRGKTNRSIPRGRIGGWLYEVTTEDLIYLDTHMENGVQFNRKRVKLRLPYDSETRNHECRHYTEQRAYAYLGDKRYWEPKIDWDTNFHGGNGTSEFNPSICRIAGSPNYSEDQWVRRYFEFNRKPVESIKMKSYIYFKGSRRYIPVSEPYEPPMIEVPKAVPADEMRKPEVFVINGETLITRVHD